MGVLENIRNDIKKNGANKGKICFIREGEKKRLRFLNDMEEAVEIVFHDNWEQRENFPCQVQYGRECEGCDNDNYRTRKFYVWTVYDYEENETLLFMYAVNNCSPIPALAGIYEEYGTLKDRDYIISCTGKGKSKTFSVVPCDKNKLRNQKLKPYSKKKIMEIIDKAYPYSLSSDEEQGGDEDEEDLYEGKTPRQLYDICIERGIEAETRKPVQYYKRLLEEWDAAQEDWPDDEENKDDEWADVDDGDVGDRFMNIPDGLDEELPFN